MKQTYSITMFLYAGALIGLSGCVGLRAPSSQPCSILDDKCAYSSERSVDGRLHHFLGEGMFVAKQSSVLISKVRWVDVETGKHIETAIPCGHLSNSSNLSPAAVRECEKSIDITDHVDQLPGVTESIYGKISL
jgi:hypothetical protein